MTKNSGKSSFRSSSSFLSRLLFPHACEIVRLFFSQKKKLPFFLFFSQSTLFLSPLGKEKIISLFTSFSHSL